jgi:hypothetical protein
LLVVLKKNGSVVIAANVSALAAGTMLGMPPAKAQELVTGPIVMDADPAGDPPDGLVIGWAFRL